MRYRPILNLLLITFLLLVAINADANTFIEIPTSLTGVRSCSIAWGDYDNDGDQDLAIAGVTSTGYTSKIYRNDGNGVFTDIGAALVGVGYCSIVWGDYDNDGDLDLALAGYNGSFVSKIYRNDSGVFTDISAGLVGVYNCSLAWGDYDNDGDLDLAIAGSAGGTSPASVTKIYRNDGAGRFTDINASLKGVNYCSLAWADYDNDGDLDLAIAGDSGSGSYIAKIYKNTNGTFADSGVSLWGCKNCSIAWGDYDCDGDFDLAIAGDTSNGAATKLYKNNGSGALTEVATPLPNISKCALALGDYDNDGDMDLAMAGSNATCRVYRYDGWSVFTDTSAGLIGLNYACIAWGDYNNDGNLDLALSGLSGGTFVSKVYRNDGGAPNTPPAPPTGLTTSVDKTSVTFTWAAASDAQTPSAGLSYNLRVGTTPGGCDILSGSSDTATGTRRITAIGNVQKKLTCTLRNMPSGRYYWSVQSVDSAYAGSAWAAEQSVIVPSVKISGYVRGTDGAGVSGVTVSPDNAGCSVVTDGNGYYMVEVPVGWSGSVVPSKSLLSFGPSSRSYTAVTADLPNQDFTAYQYPKIMGTVKTSSGACLEGVMVTASTGGTTATTDANGNYELPVVPGWSGTATPSKAFYIFSPVNKSYTNVSVDRTAQDYTATAYPKIIGCIKTPAGVGVGGVTLLGSNSGGTTTTNSDGSYELSVPLNWSGTVTPTMSLYSMSPANYSYTSVTSDRTIQDYTAAPYPKVKGRVKNALGVGVKSVKLTASSGANATTDDNGLYEFSVSPGWSGTVTPSLLSYTFNPSSLSYGSLWADQLNQDYIINNLIVASNGSIRLSPDATPVQFTGIISAVFADGYYLETESRSAGIRVTYTEYSLGVGTKVTVTGTMATLNGERYIAASLISL